MGKSFPFPQLGLRDAILGIVGGAPDQIKPVGVTRFSTNGTPSNTDGWIVPSDHGVFHFGCWRQGVTGSWVESDRKRHVQTRSQPLPAVATGIESARKERARINAAVWNRAFPLQASSPTGRYLLNRGLTLTDYPVALRMASMTYYVDGVDSGKYPVMLGAVTDHQESLLAVHRTFLTIDGNKAPVAHPKKLSQTSAPLAGAAIKLYPPQVINNKMTLGVAEGIETALACWLGSGIPTWSCISASGMKTFIWPTELESLIIFADNDVGGVGQAAARALAARAAAAGLEVRVLVPATAGADWLDVYTGEAA